MSTGPDDRPESGTATRIGPLGAVLLTIGVVAAALRAQEGADGELAPIRDNHAKRLIGLSDLASGKMLLNDAERLLLEAREWMTSPQPATDRQKSLHQRRIDLQKQPDAKDGYGRFLESKDYATARAAIRKEEREIIQGSSSQCVALARKNGGETGRPIADAAVEAAFALDPRRPDLKAVAGGERWKRLLDRRRQGFGLERLVLGATVAGRDLTLQDLKGKVVLWRSFSL